MVMMVGNTVVVVMIMVLMMMMIIIIIKISSIFFQHVTLKDILALDLHVILKVSAHILFSFFNQINVKYLSIRQCIL